MEAIEINERLNVLGHRYGELSGFATANRQKQEFAHEHWGEVLGLCNHLLEIIEFAPKPKTAGHSDRVHGEAFEAGISGKCEDCEPYEELEAENERLKALLDSCGIEYTQNKEINHER